MYSQINSHTIDSCQSLLNYEPEIWNNLDKNAHKINNCYSYIFNRIEKNRIVPVPYFVAKSQTFAEQMTIELGSAIEGNIYYTINES